MIDSYAAKLNQAKKYSQFKPYTGRDYEQFKKNYGFGFGHLGSDFDATNHREKVLFNSSIVSFFLFV